LFVDSFLPGRVNEPAIVVCIYLSQQFINWLVARNQSEILHLL